MRILAIDFGDARTGFALCDPTGLLASPLKTLHERNPQKVAEEAAGYCQLHKVETVVLGMPKNMNNTLGERAQKTLAFRDLLAELVPDTKIILWDERSTTLSATRILNTANVRGQKRKNVIDTVSAVVLLQSYLDSLR
jgi:putative Holliday junction resolvase